MNAEPTRSIKAIAIIFDLSKVMSEEELRQYLPPRQAQALSPATRTPAKGVSDKITDKQKTLIIDILSRRLSDPNERERELVRVDGFKKKDASDYIAALLKEEKQLARA